MTPEEAIRRTLSLCAQRQDDHNAAAVVELFSENASVTLPAGTFKGHAALKEMWEKGWAANPQRRSRHNLGACVIKISGETADVLTDVIPFQKEGDGPWTAQITARYEDRFVLENGSWRIAERHILIM